MPYTEPLHPGNVYHIFNHAVATDVLFKSERNYQYFLQQWTKYAEPVLDTFAWALLPNHFHAMVRVKPEAMLTKYFEQHIGLNKIYQRDGFPNAVSKSISNLFNGYAQAINKERRRMGGLFMQTFNRKLVNSRDYDRRLLYYIHHNARKHGLVNDFKDWRWSSWHSYLKDDKGDIQMEVIAWFGSIEAFIAFHMQEFNIASVFD